MDVGLACKLGSSGDDSQPEMNENAKRNAKRRERAAQIVQSGKTCLLSSVLFALALSVAPTLAGHGPVPGINTTTPYLIYYGGWNAAQVDFARRNYHLVIVDAHNITAAQIAAIKCGPDNIAGNMDDALVFSYISVGEDNRPGAPVAGDGLGPRIDPRSSDNVPLSSITNVLGLPSPGGTGYASYYLDTKNNADGIPDKNSTFGGCYINAGAPAWWTALKNMTIAVDGNAGLDELLTTNIGKGCNCDGVFLDTLDTTAPNSFGGTSYEWTAPGMQTLVQRISTNYPTKLVMANRGLFFYNPNYKHYAYTLRPYVNLVMFESYFTDSNNSDQTNPFFADNKFDQAPKINAEAGRPDGFTVVALGYDHSPPLPQSVINQDYSESMGIQGWPLYRTDPSLTSAFNTNASVWLATNADTQPPIWDSTAAQSTTPPAPRAGVQEVIGGDGTVTVRWDVARDQTGPVHYNVYYTSNPALDFAVATKLAQVIPAMPANYAAGTGPGVYPYEYTVAGLSNGVTYTFAVRAEDSAVPSHEDTNTVALSVAAGTNGAGGTHRSITIDGDFSDWIEVPVTYHGATDANPVNFADVQFANDANYLYGHFTLHSAATPFSNSNTHLFVDRDNNILTGFHPTGASFGSEMMIEGATGYDQRNGGFNEGTVSGANWLLSPGGTGTEFEFRLSLAAIYPGGAPVFNGNQFRLLLQDNRGNEVASATGIAYVLAAAPPPTYAHITVDGSTSDWAGVPVLATAPVTNSAVSFASLSAANDNDYLYLRFTLHAAGAPFSDSNTHIFIDTDNNGATGYHPSGLSMGSEMLIESGTGYDERNGTFNAGAISGLDWVLGPSGSATNFELRISRQAQYAGGAPVFTNSTIRILLQDNRGSVLIPQGVPYTFADGGPYENWRARYFTAAELADAAISGDGADPDADGIPNLVEFAFNLNPRAASHPGLPRAFLQNISGQDYLHVQYIQRGEPAGVQYLLQTSPDLLSWNTSPASFSQVSASDNGDGTSLVTLRSQSPAADAPRLFVRIAIER
jgi:hypothetical protein